MKTPLKKSKNQFFFMVLDYHVSEKAGKLAFGQKMGSWVQISQEDSEQIYYEERVLGA